MFPKFKKPSVFLVFLLAVLAPQAVLALDLGLGAGSGLGLGSAEPKVIIVNIIRIILGFLALIAVIIFLYGGFVWMTSGGAPDKVNKAKKILTSAIIGLLIILASFGIVSYLLNVFQGATTPACSDGDIRDCGCGGTQTCIGGVWNTCSNVCGPGEVCCHNASGYYCADHCYGGGGGLQACDDNDDLNDGCGAPDNCDSDSEYCDSTDCLCKPRGGFGDPCDHDNDDTNGCNEDDDKCEVDLECSTDQGCICYGDPIIDWISPAGGFCDGDHNTPCVSDDDCAAFTPSTCNTDTPNGAVGNLITIGGRYFGNSEGQVYFTGASGNADVLAANPSSVNSECTNTWTDTRIVVVVPAGAQTGPIRVHTADDREDQTNDSRGPSLEDFLVNTISRPGICSSNPLEGYYNDNFSLEGINFGGASFSDPRGVYFGNLSQSVIANNIQNWSDTHVEATVPNVRRGQTTIFVTLNNISSNFWPFTVNYDPSRDPIITYITPEQGPKGQYITVFGRNFGSEAGSVIFYDAGSDTENPASIDMPPQCQSNYWHNEYIIVKVPDVSEQDYAVFVRTNDLRQSNQVDFTVTSGQPGPGLCLLDPHNGPVGTDVDCYGDNFGSNPGSVRFPLNIDAGASSWGNQLVQTEVPVGAQNGPGLVRVVVPNGADNLLSNPLPFTVGNCLSDNDCNNGEECCGAGTYWAGICRQIDHCDDTAGIYPQCEFAWDFSTSPGTSMPDTCAGFTTAQACADAGMCPNSPGQCQTHSNPVVGECGDAYCQNQYGGCCQYNEAENRCELTGYSCDQTQTVTLDGNNYTAYCHKTGDVGVWQINLGGASCPTGSFLDLNGWCTIGSAVTPRLCAVCYNGAHCEDGICVFGGSVCPPGSSCDPDTGECISNHSTCECCCRVGHNEDCCLGLTCDPGNCGNSAFDCNPATDPNCQWGLCTGCRVELDNDLNTITVLEQEASDKACDCYGKHNRYCAISSTYPDGVCLDKKPCDGNGHQLGCQPDGDLCGPDEYCDDECYCRPRVRCQDDEGSCDDNICQDVYSDSHYVWWCNPSGGCWCDYVPCDSNPNTIDCNADNNICTSIDPDSHCDINSCVCVKDDNDSGLGQNCYNQESASCDQSFCSFQCLDEDGNRITDSNADDCGVCCCNPTANPDRCTEINPDLSCYPDISPCTGNYRGLCCGCQDDADCSGFTNSGCGNDTCCHPRPNVNSVIPADESDNVCRNPLIQAQFDQKMDLGSFTGNVILVGDYQNQLCPEGTQLLVLDSSQKVTEKPSKLSEWWQKINQFWLGLLEPFIQSAQAYTNVDNTHHYCAIPGMVKGRNGVDSSGNNYSVVEFRPSRPLDANILHYVVIKGGDDGVRSVYGISMEGPHIETFNAVTYSDSYIWSFTASDEICALAHVKVEPNNYLFQTDQDDVNIGGPAPNGCNDDDDQTNGVCYDQLNDGDKVFQAQALSADGQAIVSLPGFYSWSWSWRSDNISVVTVVDANQDSTTAQAQHIKDGRTYIWATAQISEDTVMDPSTVGQTRAGRARVYVFLCANPWPARAANGNWFPWIDENNNCNAGNMVNCPSQNFETYYCRDEGDEGTYDDLPAILNDPVVRGSSTQKNIKKEYFFFREELPEQANNITAMAQPQGETVFLDWDDVTGAAGYKVYYGTKSGNYTKTIEITGSANSQTTITGLKNGTTYYFAVSAYYDTGAESELSNEVSATPADAQPPAVPQNLAVDSSDEDNNHQIKLTWDANNDDTVKYRVYYGVSSGDYGGFSDVGDATSALITGLKNGTTYYFAVTAIDESDNESGYSNEVSAMP